MQGNVRCYCPESKCKRSTGNPFSAVTEAALIEQIRQHAEHLETCDHFEGHKEEDLPEIIRLHFLETGWRDALETPDGRRLAAPAVPIGQSPAIPRRSTGRSRSPRRAVPEPDPANLFIELANQTGELLEQATRLHKSVMRAKHRLNVYPVNRKG